MVLEIEARTALLWEGHDLGLQTLALDMTHADFDLVTDLLGRPQTVHVAGTEGPARPRFGRRRPPRLPPSPSPTTSSSLMPQPYQIRGGYRATFTDAVLEYEMRAGYTGQGPSTLTETTADGQHPIDLPGTSPYEGDDRPRAGLPHRPSRQHHRTRQRPCRAGTHPRRARPPYPTSRLGALAVTCCDPRAGRPPDLRAGEEILWDIDEYATLFIEPNAARAGGPGHPRRCRTRRAPGAPGYRRYRT